MSYRCRVQHCWTEQISLFIGILSYVLSYNFSFYIGQNPINTILLFGRTMFAPTTVSQKFVVILSYVVTLNLYIFASLPCVKGDVLQMQNRGIVTVDCVL